MMLSTSTTQLSDAYVDIAELYLSLVTQDEALATDINDPIMSGWIVNHLETGASILDASCGLGFHVVALHKGLPAVASGKCFDVFASDCSVAMLSFAIRNGARAVIEKERYKRSSFSDLRFVQEWKGRFHAVIVNNSIYTYPGCVTNYDSYFIESVRGIKHVIKPSGVVLINVRLWPGLVRSGKTNFRYQNNHDGINYICDYSWNFGEDRNHSCVLAMSNQDGKYGAVKMYFAERDVGEIILMIRSLGFDVIHVEKHGTFPMEFSTIVARTP